MDVVYDNQHTPGWKSVLPSSVFNSITVGADGYIYGVGATTNVQDGAYSDAFISKYDANGNLIWLKQLGDNLGTTSATSIKIDQTGNIYVVGFTSVGLNGNVQKGPVNDAFIAKYDISGNLIWLTQLGDSSSNTSGSSVSIDSKSNIYMIGTANGQLSGTTGLGSQDTFVAMVDSSTGMINGQPDRFSLSDYTLANSSVITNDDKLYLGGFINQFTTVNGFIFTK